MTTTTRKIHYRESDGKPMAETPVHRDDMIRAIYTLEDWFADQPDVYVSGNMMMYYEEGNPRASVSPDVFVVRGIPKRPQRDIFKLWDEAVPQFVMEVTSKTTREQDFKRKRDLFARLGVQEYFLYDPLGQYLEPALQGFRLVAGAYLPIPPDAAGGVTSEALGMRLLLRDRDRGLEFYDLSTGRLIAEPRRRAELAEDEAQRSRVSLILERGARRRAEARAAHEMVRADREAQRAEAEAQRAEAEAQRAEAEAAARRAAEERIRELERQLHQRSGGDDPAH